MYKEKAVKILRAIILFLIIGLVFNIYLNSKGDFLGYTVEFFNKDFYVCNPMKGVRNRMRLKFILSGSGKTLNDSRLMAFDDRSVSDGLFLTEE